MRADCDPETRKRISRLRLNRLSSGLALGGLVISFPPPSFFPSNTFVPFGKTADKSLLAVARMPNESRAAGSGNGFAAGGETEVKR